MQHYVQYYLTSVNRDIFTDISCIVACLMQTYMDHHPKSIPGNTKLPLSSLMMPCCTSQMGTIILGLIMRNEGEMWTRMAMTHSGLIFHSGHEWRMLRCLPSNEEYVGFKKGGGKVQNMLLKHYECCLVNCCILSVHVHQPNAKNLLRHPRR